MRLAEWKEKNGLTTAELAARIGYKPLMAHLVLRGKKGVSKKAAQRIQEATGGEVTVNELLYPND